VTKLGGFAPSPGAMRKLTVAIDREQHMVDAHGEHALADDDAADSDDSESFADRADGPRGADDADDAAFRRPREIERALLRHFVASVEDAPAAGFAIDAAGPDCDGGARSPRPSAMGGGDGGGGVKPRDSTLHKPTTASVARRWAKEHPTFGPAWNPAGPTFAGAVLPAAHSMSSRARLGLQDPVFLAE